MRRLGVLTGDEAARPDDVQPSAGWLPEGRLRLLRLVREGWQSGAQERLSTSDLTSDLVNAAMRDGSLAATTLRTEIADVLAQALDVNLILVEGQHVEGIAMPGLHTVYVHRIGPDDYRVLQPVQHLRTVSQPAGRPGQSSARGSSQPYGTAGPAAAGQHDAVPALVRELVGFGDVAAPRDVPAGLTAVGLLQLALGGEFKRGEGRDAVLAEVLADLRPGAATVVAQLLGNQPASWMIVARLPDGRLVRFDPSQDGPRRVTEIHSGGQTAAGSTGLPGTMLLAYDGAGQLAQVAWAPRSPGAAPPAQFSLAAVFAAASASPVLFSASAGVETVQSALAMVAPGGGRSVGRLRDWVSLVEPPEGADPAVPRADCVPLAYGAFVAYHGRMGNRPADTAVVESIMSLAAVLGALDGELSPVGDVAGLRDALLARPGSMTLVHVPEEPDAPEHVFWLLSDDADGSGPRLWPVDPQKRGASSVPVRLGEGSPTWWSVALARPGTRVAVLDRNGWPVSADALPALSSSLSSPGRDPRTVSGLTLASPFPPRPHGPRPRPTVPPAADSSGGGGPTQPRESSPPTGGLAPDGQRQQAQPIAMPAGGLRRVLLEHADAPALFTPTGSAGQSFVDFVGGLRAGGYRPDWVVVLDVPVGPAPEVTIANRIGEAMAGSPDVMVLLVLTDSGALVQDDAGSSLVDRVVRRVGGGPRRRVRVVAYDHNWRVYVEVDPNGSRTVLARTPADAAAALAVPAPRPRRRVIRASDIPDVREVFVTHLIPDGPGSLAGRVYRLPGLAGQLVEFRFGLDYAVAYPPDGQSVAVPDFTITLGQLRRQLMNAIRAGHMEVEIPADAEAKTITRDVALMRASYAVRFSDRKIILDQDVGRRLLAAGVPVTVDAGETFPAVAHYRDPDTGLWWQAIENPDRTLRSRHLDEGRRGPRLHPVQLRGGRLAPSQRAAELRTGQRQVAAPMGPYRPAPAPGGGSGSGGGSGTSGVIAGGSASAAREGWLQQVFGLDVPNHPDYRAMVDAMEVLDGLRPAHPGFQTVAMYLEAVTRRVLGMEDDAPVGPADYRTLLRLTGDAVGVHRAGSLEELAAYYARSWGKAGRRDAGPVQTQGTGSAGGAHGASGERRTVLREVSGDEYGRRVWLPHDGARDEAVRGGDLARYVRQASGHGSSPGDLVVLAGTAQRWGMQDIQTAIHGALGDTPRDHGVVVLFPDAADVPDGAGQPLPERLVEWMSTWRDRVSVIWSGRDGNASALTTGLRGMWSAELGTWIWWRRGSSASMAGVFLDELGEDGRVVGHLVELTDPVVADRGVTADGAPSITLRLDGSQHGGDRWDSVDIVTAVERACAGRSPDEVVVVLFSGANATGRVNGRSLPQQVHEAIGAMAGGVNLVIWDADQQSFLPVSADPEDRGTRLAHPGTEPVEGRGTEVLTQELRGEWSAAYGTWTWRRHEDSEGMGARLLDSMRAAGDRVDHVIELADPVVGESRTASGGHRSFVLQLDGSEQRASWGSADIVAAVGRALANVPANETVALLFSGDGTARTGPDGTSLPQQVQQALGTMRGRVDVYRWDSRRKQFTPVAGTAGHGPGQVYPLALPHRQAPRPTPSRAQARSGASGPPAGQQPDALRDLSLVPTAAVPRDPLEGRRTEVLTQELRGEWSAAYGTWTWRRHEDSEGMGARLLDSMRAAGDRVDHVIELADPVVGESRTASGGHRSFVLQLDGSEQRASWGSADIVAAVGRALANVPANETVALLFSGDGTARTGPDGTSLPQQVQQALGTMRGRVDVYRWDSRRKRFTPVAGTAGHGPGQAYPLVGPQPAQSSGVGHKRTGTAAELSPGGRAGPPVGGGTGRSVGQRVGGAAPSDAGRSAPEAPSSEQTIQVTYEYAGGQRITIDVRGRFETSHMFRGTDNTVYRLIGDRWIPDDRGGVGYHGAAVGGSVVAAGVDGGAGFGLESFYAAERAYQEIREGDGQVEARRVVATLARAYDPVPLTEDEVYQVWEHLFVAEHVLDSSGERRRFDAHPLVLAAWRRLRGEGEGGVTEADVTLLRHELVESRLMAGGLPFAEAHRRANESHNWQDMAGLAEGVAAAGSPLGLFAEAERAYQDIRNRTGADEARQVLATLAGQFTQVTLTEDDVEQVWRHLFVTEHELDSGPPRHFDAHPSVLAAWQRLSGASEDGITSADMVLLRHELLESQFMADGVPFAEAHQRANAVHNWQRMAGLDAAAAAGQPARFYGAGGTEGGRSPTEGAEAALPASRSTSAGTASASGVEMEGVVQESGGGEAFSPFGVTGLAGLVEVAVSGADAVEGVVATSARVWVALRPVGSGWAVVVGTVGRRVEAAAVDAVGVVLDRLSSPEVLAGVPLGELFGAWDGFQVVSGAERLRLTALPGGQGQPPPVRAYWDLAIRAGDVGDFPGELGYVLGRLDPQAAGSLGHAAEFGVHVRDQISDTEQASESGSDTGSQGGSAGEWPAAVLGFSAFLYWQVEDLMVRAAGLSGSGKPVVSTPGLAGLRAALPYRAQWYLGSNATEIADELQAFLLERSPGLGEWLREWGYTDVWEVVVPDGQGGSFTVGDFVETALRGEGEGERELSQALAMGELAGGGDAGYRAGTWAGDWVVSVRVPRPAVQALAGEFEQLRELMRSLDPEVGLDLSDNPTAREVFAGVLARHRAMVDASVLAMDRMWRHVPVSLRSGVAEMFDTARTRFRDAVEDIGRDTAEDLPLAQGSGTVAQEGYRRAADELWRAVEGVRSYLVEASKPVPPSSGVPVAQVQPWLDVLQATVPGQASIYLAHVWTMALVGWRAPVAKVVTGLPNSGETEFVAPAVRVSDMPGTDWLVLVAGQADPLSLGQLLEQEEVDEAHLFMGSSAGVRDAVAQRGGWPERVVVLTEPHVHDLGSITAVDAPFASLRELDDVYHPDLVPSRGDQEGSRAWLLDQLGSGLLAGPQLVERVFGERVKDNPRYPHLVGGVEMLAVVRRVDPGLAGGRLDLEALTGWVLDLPSGAPVGVEDVRRLVTATSAVLEKLDRARQADAVLSVGRFDVAAVARRVLGRDLVDAAGYLTLLQVAAQGGEDLTELASFWQRGFGKAREQVLDLRGVLRELLGLEAGQAGQAGQAQPEPAVVPAASGYAGMLQKVLGPNVLHAPESQRWVHALEVLDGLRQADPGLAGGPLDLPGLVGRMVKLGDGPVGPSTYTSVLDGLWPAVEALGLPDRGPGLALPPGNLGRLVAAIAKRSKQELEELRILPLDAAYNVLAGWLGLPPRGVGVETQPGAGSAGASINVYTRFLGRPGAMRAVAPNLPAHMLKANERLTPGLAQAVLMHWAGRLGLWNPLLSMWVLRGSELWTAEALAELQVMSASDAHSVITARYFRVDASTADGVRARNLGQSVIWVAAALGISRAATARLLGHGVLDDVAPHFVSALRSVVGLMLPKADGESNPQISTAELAAGLNEWLGQDWLGDERLDPDDLRWLARIDDRPHEVVGFAQLPAQDARAVVAGWVVSVDAGIARGWHRAGLDIGKLRQIADQREADVSHVAWFVGSGVLATLAPSHPEPTVVAAWVNLIEDTLVRWAGWLGLADATVAQLLAAIHGRSAADVAAVLASAPALAGAVVSGWLVGVGPQAVAALPNMGIDATVVLDIARTHGDNAGDVVRFIASGALAVFLPELDVPADPVAWRQAWAPLSQEALHRLGGGDLGGLLLGVIGRRPPAEVAALRGMNADEVRNALTRWVFGVPATTAAKLESAGLGADTVKRAAELLEGAPEALVRVLGSGVLAQQIEQLATQLAGDKDASPSTRLAHVVAGWLGQLDSSPRDLNWLADHLDNDQEQPAQVEAAHPTGATYDQSAGRILRIRPAAAAGQRAQGFTVGRLRKIAEVQGVQAPALARFIGSGLVEQLAPQLPTGLAGQQHAGPAGSQGAGGGRVVIEAGGIQHVHYGQAQPRLDLAAAGWAEGLRERLRHWANEVSQASRSQPDGPPTVSLTPSDLVSLVAAATAEDINALKQRPANQWASVLAQWARNQARQSRRGSATPAYGQLLPGVSGSGVQAPAPAVLPSNVDSGSVRLASLQSRREGRRAPREPVLHSAQALLSSARVSLTRGVEWTPADVTSGVPLPGAAARPLDHWLTLDNLRRSIPRLGGAFLLVPSGGGSRRSNQQAGLRVEAQRNGTFTQPAEPGAFVSRQPGDVEYAGPVRVTARVVRLDNPSVTFTPQQRRPPRLESATDLTGHILIRQADQPPVGSGLGRPLSLPHRPTEVREGTEVPGPSQPGAGGKRTAETAGLDDGHGAGEASRPRLGQSPALLDPSASTTDSPAGRGGSASADSADLMSGGLASASGEVVPGVTDSVGAFAEAGVGYAAIRQADGDVEAGTIVANLVRRFGGSEFTAGQVRSIWRYLFVDEHELPGRSGWQRFDPHPEILAAWYRLRGQDGHGPIRDPDVVLLRHELMESQLMAAGKSFTEAHRQANESHNWQRTAGLDEQVAAGQPARFYGAGGPSGGPSVVEDVSLGAAGFGRPPRVSGGGVPRLDEEVPHDISERAFSATLEGLLERSVVPEGSRWQEFGPGMVGTNSSGTFGWDFFRSGMFGWDYFDVGRPVDPPDFLLGDPLKDLPVQYHVAYFERLSLTRPRPMREELELPALHDFREERAAQLRRTVHVLTADAPRAMNPYGQPWVTPRYQGVPHGKVEMPPIRFALWVGRPLLLDVGRDGRPGPRSRFLLRVADTARRLPDLLNIVPVDLPRRVAEYARAHEDEEYVAGYDLVSVRWLLEFAEAENITLIDWRELYHSQHPHRAQQELLSGYAQQQGAGFAGFSDVGRPSLVFDFGGAWVDGDNHVGDRFLEDMQQALSSLHGFGIVVRRGTDGQRVIGNTVFIGPAGHGFALDVQQGVIDLYARPQDAVVDGLNKNRRVDPGLRRNSVFKRGNRGISQHLQSELYQVQHVQIESDGSWHPQVIASTGPAQGQTALGPPPVTWGHVLRQSQYAILTLQRSLRTRRERHAGRGDLHMTRMDPAVRELPHSRAVWREVLRFFARRDELRTQVGSITRRWVVSDETGQDGVRELSVDFPDDVQAWLAPGQPPSVEESQAQSRFSRDTWVLGEYVESVTLNPLPAPAAVFDTPLPSLPREQARELFRELDDLLVDVDLAEAEVPGALLRWLRNWQAPVAKVMLYPPGQHLPAWELPAVRVLGGSDDGPEWVIYDPRGGLEDARATLLTDMLDYLAEEYEAGQPVTLEGPMADLAPDLAAQLGSSRPLVVITEVDASASAPAELGPDQVPPAPATLRPDQVPPSARMVGLRPQRTGSRVRAQPVLDAALRLLDDGGLSLGRADWSPADATTGALLAGGAARTLDGWLKLDDLPRSIPRLGGALLLVPSGGGTRRSSQQVGLRVQAQRNDAFSLAAEPGVFGSRQPGDVEYVGPVRVTVRVVRLDNPSMTFTPEQGSGRRAAPDRLESATDLNGHILISVADLPSAGSGSAAPEGSGAGRAGSAGGFPSASRPSATGGSLSLPHRPSRPVTPAEPAAAGQKRTADRAGLSSDGESRRRGAGPGSGVRSGGGGPGGEVGFGLESFGEAERAYQEIRAGDGRVEARRVIATLAGAYDPVPFTQAQVYQVWEHLFVAEHVLDSSGEQRRFDAHPLVLAAWRRLRGEGEGGVTEADVTLLRHELVESRLMAGGVPFAEAHRRANESHNWQDMAGLAEGVAAGQPVQFYGAGGATGGPTVEPPFWQNLGARDPTSLGAADRALADQGTRYLEAAGTKAGRDVLTQRVTDVADLPRRLRYLADLVTATASGDDERLADAAVLRAAEMVTRRVRAAAVSGEVGPFAGALASDAKVTWMEWLRDLGRLDQGWEDGMSAVSMAMMADCIPMGIPAV